MLACLKSEIPVIERLDYLRSRIRLTRALAVYTPGLALLSTYGLARMSCSTAIYALWWCTSDGEQYGSFLVVISYLLWFIFSSFAPKLPRTDDPTFVASAKNGIWINHRGVGKKKKTRPELSIWSSEWQTWVIPTLLLIAGSALATAIYSFRTRSDSITLAIFLVPATGALLTVLSAWSWWRISMTYRTFLLDLEALNSRDRTPM